MDELFSVATVSVFLLSSGHPAGKTGIVECTQYSESVAESSFFLTLPPFCQHPRRWHLFCSSSNVFFLFFSYSNGLVFSFFFSFIPGLFSDILPGGITTEQTPALKPCC